MMWKRAVSVMITALMLLINVTLIPGQVYAETSQSDGESSFEYKYFSDNDAYRAELKRRMNRVYENFSSCMDDNKTVPIPGLINTYSIHKGEISQSDQYVPQGLCLTGRYMLVTAYDVEKKHYSVIYVIDVMTNELVSTLTLPNKYHAGGIAFDGENIWMTGDTSDKYKGEPFVQYMTFETFRELIKEPVKEVEKTDISDRIYIKNKPSFLECNNGVLWVGTYIGRRATSEGYLNGYKIIGEPGARKLNTVLYSVITGIDSSAQGADIKGRYLYVSSSYKGTSKGVKTSFITKYSLGTALQTGTDIYVADREINRLEVPKMNEEIIVDGDMIHINFESGAEHWERAVVNTDRILAVKESAWGIGS